MKHIISNAVKFAAGFAVGLATMFVWPFFVAFWAMKYEYEEGKYEDEDKDWRKRR